MTQSDELIKLAKDNIVSYHIDQFNRVHIKLGENQEPTPLRGKATRSWLTNIYYESTQSAPGSKAISSTQDILEGIALKQGTPIEVADHFGNPVEDDKALSERLIDLIIEQNPVLYLDERKEPYIFIPRDEREASYENHRVSSTHIKSWMAWLLWTNEGKAPSSETLSSAVNILNAMAYTGGEHQLYNRVSPDGNGGIYIDMADEGWNLIHVSIQGWMLTKKAFPIFRRYRHQQPLPLPKKGGKVSDLLEYVNINDPVQQMLYLIWIVSCFIPDISHTILSVHGPQGTGKTLLHELAKRLIDPSIKLPAAIPENQGDLIQTLDHQYCAIFDNVSYLSQNISDDLCRAVTGGGFSKRKLWTDDEDIIFSFKRCIGLNGINIPAERGDLIERCLSLELSPISEQKRRGRIEILEAFEEKAGLILGAILDTLSIALSIYPTIKHDSLYRMADFTKWGYAIAKALGYNPRDFLSAYGENLDDGSIDAVDHSITGELLKLFMTKRKHETWEDTPMKLFEEFNQVAQENRINANQRDYQKNPTRLSRELNRLSADLRKLGFTVTRRRANGQRLIRIESSSFEPKDPQQTFKTYTVEYDPEAEKEKREHESLKGSLSTDLKKLITCLRELENSEGGAVKRGDLFEAMLEKHGWNKVFFDKVLQVALRDGSIYVPRPEYLGVTP